MEKIIQTIRVHADSYYQFIKTGHSEFVKIESWEPDGPDHYMMTFYSPVFKDTTTDEIVTQWVEFMIQLSKFGAI